MVLPCLLLGEKEESGACPLAKAGVARSDALGVRLSSAAVRVSGTACAGGPTARLAVAVLAAEVRRVGARRVCEAVAKVEGAVRGASLRPRVGVGA